MAESQSKSQKPKEMKTISSTAVLQWVAKYAGNTANGTFLNKYFCLVFQ